MRAYAIAIGEEAKHNNKKGRNDLEEVELRILYYSMMDSYYQRTSFPFTPPPSRKGLTMWSKVAEYKRMAGVSAEVYIKAQFAWCDKCFGSPPTFAHLMTENAVNRALQFSGLPGRVVTSAVPMQSEKAELLKQTDAQIRAICKAQSMTKAEFYREIVIPGLMILPHAYTSIDPEYLAACAARDSK